MKTDFHAILRNKSPELSREQIDAMSYSEATSYYWSVTRKNYTPKPRDSRDSVCFTGFTAAEKEALGEIADALDHRVAKSVIAGLTYLVFGPNAGPKKLEKATAQGVAIISEADYRQMEKANKP